MNSKIAVQKIVIKGAIPTELSTKHTQQHQPNNYPAYLKATDPFKTNKPKLHKIDLSIGD
jgi:hypothetical protein